MTSVSGTHALQDGRTSRALIVVAQGLLLLALAMVANLFVSVMSLWLVSLSLHAPYEGAMEMASRVTRRLPLFTLIFAMPCAVIVWKVLGRVSFAGLALAFAMCDAIFYGTLVFGGIHERALHDEVGLSFASVAIDLTPAMMFGGAVGAISVALVALPFLSLAAIRARVLMRASVRAA